MDKILVVDDDDAMRGMIKMRLADSYEMVDTGNPVEALELALKHRPRAILLDLMMPDCSGFELCQSLHNLSYTARIPIFVVTGESAAKYRDYMNTLGAAAFFEKPIDFVKLKAQLKHELETTRTERRNNVRVRMKLVLKLKGADASGRSFEQLTSTENVSAGGFLCTLSLDLEPNSTFQVFLLGAGQEQYAGKVRPVRCENRNSPLQKYGFHFVEKTPEWILQD
jgi:response regulator RpfG family c-di-GMP phosphodiesterase